MCNFKFLDFTPEEIIKIMEHDIKQYQRKYDYHTGLAKYYQNKIEDLEVQIGNIHQKKPKGEIKMKKECKYCSSKNVVTIFWGYPADMDYVMKLVDEKKLVLGGCCVSDNDPALECIDCGQRSGNRGDADAN